MGLHSLFKSLFCASLITFPGLARAQAPTPRPVTIPFRYSKPLTKQGFASPLVRVILNKKTGVFLVDSGASIHVVADWFAVKAGIVTPSKSAASSESALGPVLGGSTGTESGGQIISVDLGFRGGIIPFKNQTAVVTPFPEVFEKNQIAGILSPQQLITETELGVLNLKKPSLSIEPIAAYPPGATIPLKASISTGPENTTSILYMMSAEVEGHPTSFIVDTGAEDAGIGMETGPGSKLLPRSKKSSEKVGGLSGEPQEVRVLKKAAVKVLDRKHFMRIRLQPTSHKMPADGMMGMRFLKKCTLYMTWASGALDCR